MNFDEINLFEKAIKFPHAKPMPGVLVGILVYRKYIIFKDMYIVYNIIFIII